MAIIAKYKFNPSLYADYLPTFNKEFTGYIKTDVTNNDGTITRTISHDNLKPTSMRFGSYDGVITNKVKSLLEVIECDTSNITTMSNMFRGCSNLTLLNTSNFDTSNVTTMSCLFHDCSSLTSLNVSNFNTSQVTTMNNMFFNCSSLISLDLFSFNTSQVTDMVAMFYDCTKLTSLDLSNFDTGKVTNMNSMFYNCPVSDIRLLYATSSTINSLLTPLETSVARTIYYQQASLSDLTKQNNITYVLIEPTPIAKYKFDSSLYADYLPVFNTEFTGYTKTDINNSDGTITRIISHDTLKPTFMRFGVDSEETDREKSLLEVMECDTSNVTNMQSMFQCCTSLTSLDLSSFNTSKVNNMNAMFYKCNKLSSLDLSSFNTSQVTIMASMFQGCTNLISLNLSSFDTSKVTNMANMFNSCSSLTSLDLSSFNTGKVTNMSWMFGGCSVSDIGLLYATSSTINTLLTHLGTSVARNIYYMDAPLNELEVQDNITYKKYELSRATFPYTLNKLPNGVADYIDVVNKVHVQRVGKVVFDGSDDERWTYFGSDNDGLARMVEENYKSSVRDSLVICDKFVSIQNWNTGGERCYFGVNGMVFFKNIGNYATSLEYTSSWKSYLTSNSITVLYELATPIYTPLTEEEIAQLPLSAYADGYINLSSDQLTPSFEFRMRASNRYQVDMLETGYYYLNAPTGNVKLGTASVDVQQMPCIVKVDNVGTGDSGYRLTTNANSETYCLNLPLDFESGYLDISNGNIITDAIANGRWASDFIEIPYYNKMIYIINKCEGVDLVYYDENKSFIGGTALGNVDKSRECWLTSNTSVKYIRMSGKNDEMVIQLRELPITLAKLPSHRIPTSFTQGMKCGTDFGYWEGIKEAQTYGVQTANKTTINGFETIELYGIEIGGSFVEDEFDISIGKLTKRIGVKKLVGIEDWVVAGSVLENSVLFQLYVDGVMAEANTSENYVFNDKYPRKTGDRLWSTETYGVGGNTDVIRIRLNLPYRTVDEFKRFLSLNPITVYYRLRVPEITYLTPQFSQMKATNSSTRINVLKNSANNKLFPQVKPSHLTYPVPSLVGNRTYTVVHNRKNITGSTKPIELNLGGTVVQLNDASSKTLVKTPSTLAHGNLIFIGGESTVDHIMVLDGDWTNKPIEYFENMMGHDTDAIITIIGNGQIDDVEEQYLW